MEKRCFLKVSWQDPDQPLTRIHENIESIWLDMTKDIVSQVMEQDYNLELYVDFTVDFILVLE